MNKKLLCVISAILVALSLCFFASCNGCGGKTGELKSSMGVTLTGGNFGKKAKLITEKVEMTEENAKSRSTSLRSTLNLGAEYTLLNNKLGFGLLSSTQFTQPEAYSELTISANYRPKNWFGVSLSYSFLHSDFETLGIGLKLGSIFIGSDYLMTKSLGDANRANVYLGVSVPLGKKRQDYRRK